VPAVFLAFAIFVSFIQAFVFTLLTMIYINLAKPQHEEHDEGHGHAHAH
jgi:F0F1-type ATP synthase membrane subunit a